MEPTSSFGYWLRRRRKALDLTQDELAQRVGCAVGTISKIEADERRPSQQLAERLADCLRSAADERAAFLQAARAELAVDRLDRADAASWIDRRRLRRGTPLPSGTVTFLFTDIEGSTQLWEQHPQAMPRRAGPPRRPPARRRSQAHGGRGLQDRSAMRSAPPSRSAPDALRRRAGRPARARTPRRGARPARCACAWRCTPAMAEQRDGDYFGPPLNRVARLLAAGHGGQILLSLATAGAGARAPAARGGAARPGRAPAQRPQPPRADLPARRARPAGRLPAAADARRAPHQPAGPAHRR